MEQWTPWWTPCKYRIWAMKNFCASQSVRDSTGKDGETNAFTPFAIVIRMLPVVIARSSAGGSAQLGDIALDKITVACEAIRSACAEGQPEECVYEPRYVSFPRSSRGALMAAWPNSMGPSYPSMGSKGLPWATPARVMPAAKRADSENTMTGNRQTPIPCWSRSGGMRRGGPQKDASPAESKKQRLGGGESVG